MFSGTPACVEGGSKVVSDFNRQEENQNVYRLNTDNLIEGREFIKEVGDEVYIGEVENLHFQVNIDARQDDYQNDSTIQNKCRH